MLPKTIYLRQKQLCCPKLFMLDKRNYAVHNKFCLTKAIMLSQSILPNENNVSKPRLVMLDESNYAVHKQFLLDESNYFV